MKLNEIMAPDRKYHVYWGFTGKKAPKGTMGYYIIDAKNERLARKEAKRYLDARFISGGYRIMWVTDVTPAE